MDNLGENSRIIREISRNYPEKIKGKFRKIYG